MAILDFVVDTGIAAVVGIALLLVPPYMAGKLATRRTGALVKVTLLVAIIIPPAVIMMFWLIVEPLNVAHIITASLVMLFLTGWSAFCGRMAEIESPPLLQLEYRNVTDGTLAHRD